MRRIKSAPADICMMHHRTRTPPPHLQSPSCAVLCAVPSTSLDATADRTADRIASKETCVVRVRERVGESEALGEVVTSVSNELHVNDSTEQLFFFLLVRWITTLDASGIAWRKNVRDACMRLVVSYVTHHVMTWFVSRMHVIDVGHLTQHSLHLPLMIQWTQT